MTPPDFSPAAIQQELQRVLGLVEGITEGTWERVGEDICAGYEYKDGKHSAEWIAEMHDPSNFEDALNDGWRTYSPTNDANAALITQAPALARDYSAALGEIERMTAERDAYRDALSIYADLSTNYRGKVTQLTLDALWGQAREAIVKYGCVNCAAQTFEDGMVCCWTCGRELPRAALAPPAQADSPFPAESQRVRNLLALAHGRVRDNPSNQGWPQVRDGLMAYSVLLSNLAHPRAGERRELTSGREALAGLLVALAAPTHAPVPVPPLDDAPAQAEAEEGLEALTAAALATGKRVVIEIMQPKDPAEEEPFVAYVGSVGKDFRNVRNGSDFKKVLSDALALYAYRQAIASEETP